MPHVSRNDLTADEVRRQFSYDPLTGKFERLTLGTKPISVKPPHPKIERKPKRIGTVVFIPRLQKWMAQYKREYLGVFISTELAERAITERIELGTKSQSNEKD